MAKLVEFIPNFSEGRDQNVIDGLVNVAESVLGATLVDYSSDTSHNRSVFTLVGSPQAIEQVAFDLVEYAANHIDMTRHQGEHPRMGAADVIPIVPLKNITSEECVEMARRIGERIGSQLKIPVYLYEDAATSSSRKNLAKVRKGQFEGMTEKVQQPNWQPDFGPANIHPTAGVTAVGVRKPLVAFNVNLQTADIDIANRISRAVRGSSGGFKHIKAMGVELEDRGIVQVSMSVEDFEKAPLYRVLETIRFEAKRYGVSIIGSEIIGLTPAKALIDSANYYLQVEEFDSDQQIIENHLIKD